MQKNLDEKYQEVLQQLSKLGAEATKEQFIDEISTILRKLEAESVRWYSIVALKIFDLLNTPAYRNTDEAKKISYVLANEILSKAKDEIPVKTEIKLLYHLSSEKITERKDWRDVRLQRARFWLHAWKRIEMENDVDFNPEDLPELNVCPPTTANLPSGVSPEAINDLSLRREYEQAIENNRLKMEYYNRQYLLRKLDPEYKIIAKYYLADLYSKEPAAIDEIKRLMTECLPAGKEAEEVIELIKK